MKPLNSDLKNIINKLIEKKYIPKQIIGDIEFLVKNIKKTNVLNFVETLFKITPKKRPSLDSLEDRVLQLLFVLKSVDGTLKKSYYSDLLEYFDDVIKLNTVDTKVIVGKPLVKSIDDLSNIIRVNNTNYLKNFKLKYKGKDLGVTDEMFMGMMRDDKYTDRYIKAIENGDISLKDDDRSYIGILYTFFKEMKRLCDLGGGAEEKLKRLYGFNFNKISNKNLNLKNVDSLVISELIHRNSYVFMDYYLFDSSGNRVGGSFDGLFLYYKLDKNHQFVNQDNKNIFFKFRDYIPVNKINKNEEYHVLYNSINVKNEKMRIWFTNFDLGQKEKEDTDNKSIIPACNALVEFMEVFNSFNENRNFLLL